MAANCMNSASLPVLCCQNNWTPDIDQKKAPADAVTKRQGLPRADRLRRISQPYSGSYPAPDQKKAPLASVSRSAGLGLSGPKKNPAGNKTSPAGLSRSQQRNTTVILVNEPLTSSSPPTGKKSPAGDVPATWPGSPLLARSGHQP